MWSDGLDKNIRDAANSDLHSFEEAPWQKMELLLDEHLPQEKRRRRFIFFLLAGLLIGSAITGSVIFYRHSTIENKKISQQEANNNHTTISPEKNSIKNPALNAASDDPVIKKEQPSATLIEQSANQKISKEKTLNDANRATPPDMVANKEIASSKNSISFEEKNIQPVRNNKNIKPIKASPKEIVFSNNKTSDKGEKTPDQYNNNQAEDISSKPLIIKKPASSVSGNNESNIEDKKTIVQQNEVKQHEVLTDTVTGKQDLNNDKSDISDADLKITTQQPDKKETSSIQKNSRFALYASLGPDISAVGTNPGSWRMQYGLGIGYSVSEHITVRTGFFVARKIYSADSTSYKTPYNTLYNYLHLEKINANCLVYEIPLTVAYNIIHSPKNNLFASTGLSSYLMKKEDYDYFYKSVSGYEQKRNYSYKNGSHIFSVLNLSAGYQYNFSNRLSVIAEPYIKIPVTGIGYGKVNLNSAGVLVSVGFKPFLQTIKKK